MTDESGKQKLGVQSGTGATTGVDAGTNQEQTNRRTTDQQQDNKPVKTGTGAGGTSITANTAATYGAGDPENSTGGTSSGGVGAGTTGHGTGADMTGIRR